MNRFILVLLALLPSYITFASAGDTTKIRVFDKMPLNHYGNFSKWAHFPKDGKTYQKVWMKYTIGCESNGQCEWDYTNTMYVRQHTGIMDSTLNQAPWFKVNGKTPDSLAYAYTQTYNYFFDSLTRTTDSVAATKIMVVFYNNSQNPILATDTQFVFPLGQYKYMYDSTGRKTDSLLIAAEGFFKQKYTAYYTKSERLVSYELGRIITPYAKTFTKSFTFIYPFDVSDYASLLKDSSEIVFNYSGYTWGFTCTLDFYFVEGTPIRTLSQVVNTWNGSWTYGAKNKPIEQYLPIRYFKVNTFEKSAKLRITVTGHGAENNEGCSEFCSKNMQIFANGKLLDNRPIWRDKCGSNAIINQGGTWIFDRGNWCPGERVEVWEYELPLQADSNSVDIQIDTFTANGSASYSIGSSVHVYSDYAFSNDASLEKIVAPSSDFWNNRLNPICHTGKIVIRNTGKNPLTSLKIHTQVGKNAEQIQAWTGHLAFQESATVELSNFNFSGTANKDTCIIRISEPNGTTDENSLNNQLGTNIIRPIQTPLSFIIETITNKHPKENLLTVKDEWGKIILQHGFDSASHLYSDTLHLNYGCYSIDLLDSAGDGLDFWYNRDSAGTGGFRLMKYQPSYGLIKNFNPDFGSFIHIDFTAGTPLDVHEMIPEQSYHLFPNPADQEMTFLFDSENEYELEVITLDGKSLATYYSKSKQTIIPTAHFPDGIYILLVRSKDSSSGMKFSIIHP